jgi:hypothetical protein
VVRSSISQYLDDRNIQMDCGGKKGGGARERLVRKGTSVDGGMFDLFAWFALVCWVYLITCEIASSG